MSKFKVRGKKKANFIKFCNITRQYPLIYPPIFTHNTLIIITNIILN